LRLLGVSEGANDPAIDGAIDRRRAFLLLELSEQATDPANDGAIVRRRAFLLPELSEQATDPANDGAIVRSSLDPFSLALALNTALATFMLTVSILNRLQFSSPDIFFYTCLDIDGGPLRMSNYLFFLKKKKSLAFILFC
jgi:hypothetical protein